MTDETPSKRDEEMLKPLLEGLAGFRDSLRWARSCGLIVIAYQEFKEDAIRLGYGHLTEMMHNPLDRVDHPRMSLRDRLALLFGLKPSRDWIFIKDSLVSPGIRNYPPPLSRGASCTCAGVGCDSAEAAPNEGGAYENGR